MRDLGDRTSSIDGVLIPSHATLPKGKRYQRFFIRAQMPHHNRVDAVDEAISSTSGLDGFLFPFSALL